MLLVEEELKRMVPERDSVLSIGIFDGVHLGHQFLISELRERASKGDFLVGVVTFRQHPHVVLTGQKLPFLTSLAERVRLLRSIGVELIVTLSFTYDLSTLRARDYLLLLTTTKEQILKILEEVNCELITSLYRNLYPEEGATNEAK